MTTRMYSSSTDYKTSHRSVGGGGGGISASTSGAARTATSGGSDRFASSSSSTKLVKTHSRSKSVDETSKGEATSALGGVGGESSNISYHRTTSSNIGGGADNRRSTSISRDYKSRHDFDSLSRGKAISSVGNENSTSVSHRRIASVGGTGGSCLLYTSPSPRDS